jgi:hypothetical protein
MAKAALPHHTQRGCQHRTLRARPDPRFARRDGRDPRIAATRAAEGSDRREPGRIQVIEGWLDADGAVHERIRRDPFSTTLV